ncbi:protein SYS1 [Aspergillus ruber CBS 135680]|uniref:Integral membrane protein S linking to the trans Golgi network-domain-containing protein n=1 Tax=Aspergillus ruber (strain CBS 135680) TaxID=1388766 RepID=A0A017SN38_ASPRC|nr:uncharacterized protein EURHEDRAFT_409545 [Aspergillus ruber CBS 135680]EYE98211.1 hypothetical protein EURHEDRAFT_409545 [Aspergillus ruber CBS 135680]
MPRRRPPPAGARTDLPPLGIVRKILLLQLGYYLTATALILFTTLVYGRPFSFDLLLNWDAIRGDTTIGWILGLVWMLNSLLGVILLLLLVSRSKLIPDFALTIHFVHLIATSLYTHTIPANWLWWGLQFASASLMVFLGMWACRYRELQPITFGIGGGSSSSSQQTSDPSEQGGEDFASGSRGRGREGGDEFEMGLMKGAGEAV